MCMLIFEHFLGKWKLLDETPYNSLFFVYIYKIYKISIFLQFPKHLTVPTSNLSLTMHPYRTIPAANQRASAKYTFFGFQRILGVYCAPFNKAILLSTRLIRYRRTNKVNSHDLSHRRSFVSKALCFLSFGMGFNILGFYL